MKLLILVAIVQSLNLVVFVWFYRVAGLRIIALRQQLIFYKRTSKKPMLKNTDRLFWSLLSRIWNDRASELIYVNPETVIRWRNRKFREFWRKKSQSKSGRPTIAKEHIAFIRRISPDHPEYGEDRIALELEVKFGMHHASSTVRRSLLSG
jgi:putative transposase